MLCRFPSIDSDQLGINHLIEKESLIYLRGAEPPEVLDPCSSQSWKDSVDNFRYAVVGGLTKHDLQGPSDSASVVIYRFPVHLTRSYLTHPLSGGLPHVLVTRYIRRVLVSGTEKTGDTSHQCLFYQHQRHGAL